MNTYFKHETAIVDNGALIGDDTKIWHWSHICSGARIGKSCNLGQNIFIADGTVIGNRVKIQNNVSVYSGVTLEDEVFCGPSMVFTNVINPRGHVNRRSEYMETIVRYRATIGANATIVCGVEIGTYAFVGAGSVVTKNVLPHALVVGNPARQIGWMCSCGTRLEFSNGWNTVCSCCGTSYEIEDDQCIQTSATSNSPC